MAGKYVYRFFAWAIRTHMGRVKMGYTPLNLCLVTMNGQVYCQKIAHRPIILQRIVVALEGAHDPLLQQ